MVLVVAGVKLRADSGHPQTPHGTTAWHPRVQLLPTLPGQLLQEPFLTLLPSRRPETPAGPALAVSMLYCGG